MADKHKYLLQLRHAFGCEDDKTVTFESIETNVNAVILDAEAQGVVGWRWEVHGVTNCQTGALVC